ncbi:hypothetical protein A3H53_04555 [Candidatus Nomurabacteria bacterium RIFCSPLOWO2_02_FULL_40_10]|uniref:HTH cro/C1-type domain-containing protein n=2 Tax=Candidatus Nomuraibacteriota TaxID=1752729 RepID=A0A1F6XV37_9BACT|nr:MAG: hypothetical protein A2642_03195 [Candidatus Nomurabacteria bacterium RIFCSPHIGHO2_01_FULL_39_10]OGI97974.1 MAG: hypothetical protein A3H53_04555 [Candidatus Nomurabacteria bacterium RIFCSPLOWO2_02_FULL_40_10]
MKKEQTKKVNAKSLPKFSIIHNELMKDLEFRKEYDALEPEYALINAIIEARIKKNISQKMLAKRLGTGQSAISRLESGTYNPTFKFAQKLAKALETDLTFTFSK